ncbi:MAG: hypothetical protein WCJ30_02760 [Deltaproteobacteria bacterium]
MKKTNHRNPWIVTALTTIMLLAARAVLAFNATGGNLARMDGYRIHTFTNNGALTVSATGLVEVLAVAGTKISVFRFVESPGLLRDDPHAPWTAGEIAARWDDISAI